MSGKYNRLSRRSFLATSGATLLGAGITGAVTARKSGRTSKKVPPGLAKKVAERQRQVAADDDSFADWKDADLGKRETFYMVTRNGPKRKFKKGAYVFPVVDGSKDLGYITTAARREMDPILEYSKATPPSAKFDDAKDFATKHGRKAREKPIYHGGAKYGLELSNGDVMNVRNGRPSSPKQITPSKMAFDEARSERKWRGAEKLGSSPKSVTANSEPPIAYGDDADHVYGVPCWTEHDEGREQHPNIKYSNIGAGPDRWDKWDGCAPVAASMIIGYQEHYTEADEDRREFIIDTLHLTMETDMDGATPPTKIDNGIDDYYAGVLEYNGKSYYTGDKQGLLRDEIKNDRPCLLNLWSGDRAADRPDTDKAYGNHVVTVVGYVDNGDQIEIHDTWDDERHRLNWGAWIDISITTVHPE